MTNLSNLKEIISRCRCAGYCDAAKCFNEIRGKQLGRAYCDFTDECMPIIEELEQKTADTKFIEELRILVGGREKTNNEETYKAFDKVTKTLLAFEKEHSINEREI
ncbi:hypothetical protein [Acetivibrio ethanolgignens]|nr:hypothetical protein [Acetivibrio ethanolgignens]